jgi:hypothetical protein
MVKKNLSYELFLVKMKIWTNLWIPPIHLFVNVISALSSQSSFFSWFLLLLLHWQLWWSHVLQVCLNLAHTMRTNLLNWWNLVSISYNVVFPPSMNFKEIELSFGHKQFSVLICSSRLCKCNQHPFIVCQQPFNFNHKQSSTNFSNTRYD